MEGSTGHTPYVMLAWLIHPATVLAIAVLVVNDHLLKSAYPGVVTGKLSDVAGQILLPPLLGMVIAALAPHRSPKSIAIMAISLSGAGFALVKAFPAGAAAASALWSAAIGPSLILADRTDLIALPTLGLSAWIFTRAARNPAPRLALRRLGVFVVLPTAVLAVAATAAGPERPDTVVVGSWHELIVVGQSNAIGSDRTVYRWLVSDQNFRVWRQMTPDERDAFVRESSTVRLGSQHMCVPDDPARCYRIVRGHLRVEQSSDAGATWAVSWEVPDNRRSYLARSYDELGDISTYLSTQVLVVQPTTAGHIVVAANGRDGIAVRDATGQWRRIALSGRTAADETTPAPPLDGDLPGTEWAGGILMALMTVSIGGWMAAGRARVLAGMFVAVSVVGSALALVGLVQPDDSPAEFVMVSFGFLLVGIGTLGAVASATTDRKPPTRLLPLLTAGALATGAGWYAAFNAWAHGSMQYREAALLAVVAALAGTTLTGWLVHRYAKSLQVSARPGEGHLGATVFGVDSDQDST